MLAGNISCIEITFDPSSEQKCEETLEGIALLNREFGSAICIGAGTVLTAAQVRAAADAGALYMISPDVCEDVIRETKRLGRVSMPGAFTPTEAITAHRFGADIIKLFPAGLLGPNYFKALKAPFPHLKFAAVGGIGETNAADFIRAGASALGIGGNLVDTKLCAAGEFAEITRRARKIAQAAGG